MRVFVTGATGYLGGAIAARLVRAGHEVTALVRSPDRAASLGIPGLGFWTGDLGDLAALLVPLRNCDAVVHVAVDPRDRAGADARLLEAVRLAALDGRVRRFLYTSGVWVHGDTGGAIADERSPLAAPAHVGWRPAHENRALDLGDHEVRVGVLRPGMVYGERRGTFGDWFDEAAERGTITYPGDGGQHWGTVHRDDVAEAYALALESAAGGGRYLLVDETRFTVRELAEAAARAAGARAIPSGRELPPRTSAETFAALRMDQLFTSARARAELGWKPVHGSFVAEAPARYEEWRSAPRVAAG
jgi:nucleoside-diphosphate-sugar epimerase